MRFSIIIYHIYCKYDYEMNVNYMYIYRILSLPYKVMISPSTIYSN